MDEKAKAILDYWFGDLDHSPAYFRQRNPMWFMGGKKVDEEIRGRFAEDVELAAAGKLSRWETTPRGLLALVVLLDQFALNLYRDQAQGYVYSDRAIPLALKALERGWHRTLTPAEKTFLYMPLEHAEDLGHQARCVGLFTELRAAAPAELAQAMDGSLDYALRHYRVVQRFGRFPHRNEALGRQSSAAEKAFLQSEEAPF